MKKLNLSVLMLTLALSMTACGNTQNQVTSPSTTEAPAPTEAPTQEPVATEAPETTAEPEVTAEPESTEAPSEGEVSDAALGATLLAYFNDMLAQDPETDAYTLAEKLATHESILFAGGAVEIEEGFLSGFNNYEVTGFEQGVMFAPMMGTIPFVGYVFTLPEDADTEAFMNGLKENADLRWNICTAADEMYVEANGNKVFFLMCPLTLEQ